MSSNRSVDRGLRRRLTVIAILLMIPIAFWPGGEILEGVLSPEAYMIWVVVGLPAILVCIFAINAYLNVQEDSRLESDRQDRGDVMARAESSEGDD